MRTTLHHLLLLALAGPGCVFAGQEGEEFEPTTTETPGDGALDADDSDFTSTGLDSAGREDTGTDPTASTDTDADDTAMLGTGHTGDTGDTGATSDTGLPTQ